MAIKFGSIAEFVANSIPTTAIINFASTVKGYLLNEFGAPNGPLSLNSQRITNLASATATGDAANKGQMDTADAATLASAKAYVDGKLPNGTLARVSRGQFTGDGAAVTFDITHNIGSTTFVIFITDNTNQTVLVDTYPQSVNVSRITFAQAPANGVAYNWTVVG